MEGAKREKYAGVRRMDGGGVGGGVGEGEKEY